MIGKHYSVLAIGFGQINFGKLYSGRFLVVPEIAPNGLAFSGPYLVVFYYLPGLGYVGTDISTQFSVGFKGEVELPCNSATTPNGTEQFLE